MDGKNEVKGKRRLLESSGNIWALIGRLKIGRFWSEFDASPGLDREFEEHLFNRIFYDRVLRVGMSTYL